jgi:hypothetical protein
MLEKVYWEIPNRALVATYSDIVSLDDLLQSEAAVQRELEGLPPDARIILINDMSKRTGMEVDLNNLSRMLELGRRTQRIPQIEQVVMVDATPSALMRTIANIAEKLELLRVKRFLTLEAALTFAAQGAALEVVS